MNKNRTFELTITHYKILETVYLLNKESFFPLSSGVNKILMGADDKETLPYKDYPTYGTLISLPNKKLSRIINMLERHNYLTKVYDENTDDSYLAITNLGVSYLTRYLEKRKKPYPKKKINSKPTIVKIEK